jgi:ABC-type multidrug transport system fused ATPase/permease subunit
MVGQAQSATVMNVLGAVTSGVLLWIMGGAVIERAITLGTLVLFLQFAGRLPPPIRDLADKLALFQTAPAATERITELLAEPAEETQPSAAPVPPFDPVAFALTRSGLPIGSPTGCCRTSRSRLSLAKESPSSGPPVPARRR